MVKADHKLLFKYAKTTFKRLLYDPATNSSVLHCEAIALIFPHVMPRLIKMTG